MICCALVWQRSEDFPTGCETGGTFCLGSAGGRFIPNEGESLGREHAVACQLVSKHSDSFWALCSVESRERRDRTRLTVAGPGGGYWWGLM